MGGVHRQINVSGAFQNPIYATRPVQQGRTTPKVVPFPLPGGDRKAKACFKPVDGHLQWTGGAPGVRSNTVCAQPRCFD